MALSTNSIIHYTNSIDTLKLILKEGFKLKYCNESLALGDVSSNAAHPMVSFCDIPLSESSKHFEAYGHFGIGLTKTWAVEQGINPVLYIDKDSLIGKSILELIRARRKVGTNLTIEQQSLILKIKSYAKNYSGKLVRNGKTINKYRFYDEREWRLVPDKSILGASSFSISSQKYQLSKDGHNAKLDSIRIIFNHQDISYIIVEKTNQIPEIIKSIKECFSDKCTANQLDILLSRVCSAEQIKADY
jgi:hypothetical protein